MEARYLHAYYNPDHAAVPGQQLMAVIDRDGRPMIATCMSSSKDDIEGVYLGEARFPTTAERDIFEGRRLYA